MKKTEYREKLAALKAERANLEGEAREAKNREIMELTADYNAERTEREASNATIEMGAELRAFLRENKPNSSIELRAAFPGHKTTDVSTVIGSHTQAVLDKAFDDKVIYTAAGCPVIGAAAGITDWIYAGGVSVKIVNELTGIGDSQKLDLTKISAVQNRISTKIIFSNQSLENDTEADLMALAMRKINAAYAEAINFAATSTAKYGANFYGGFAHASKQTTTYTKFDYAKAMEMVGMVAEKNYEAGYGVFVMGPADYYALKATPLDAGSGRFVIDEYGRLGGFPVFVSNSINRTTVKGAIAGHNIGFGLFNYLPCMQHGTFRLSIDSQSSDAADVDGVIVTCNADWSMTNLYPDAFVLASQQA